MQIANISKQYYNKIMALQKHVKNKTMRTYDK